MFLAAFCSIFRLEANLDCENKIASIIGKIFPACRIIANNLQIFAVINYQRITLSLQEKIFRWEVIYLERENESTKFSASLHVNVITWRYPEIFFETFAEIVGIGIPYPL